MGLILNVDAGELASEPDELYALAHLVHVACGGHAGDAASMERVVRLASAAGTWIGAHPSYPDREGFGRRTLTIGSTELRVSLGTQCRALAAIAERLGVAVVSVKPHGALYHDAHANPARAAAVAETARAVFGPDVMITGPARGMLEEAARASGLRFLREGFADRGVRSDGSLVPRGEPGALVTDPQAAAARATAFAKNLEIDTVCVHGDTPDALAIARAVRRALDEARA